MKFLFLFLFLFQPAPYAPSLRLHKSFPTHPIVTFMKFQYPRYETLDGYPACEEQCPAHVPLLLILLHNANPSIRCVQLFNIIAETNDPSSSSSAAQTQVSHYPHRRRQTGSSGRYHYRPLAHASPVTVTTSNLPENGETNTSVCLDTPKTLASRIR